MIGRDNDVYRPSDRDLLKRVIRETAARSGKDVMQLVDDEHAHTR